MKGKPFGSSLKNVMMFIYVLIFLVLLFLCFVLVIMFVLYKSPKEKTSQQGKYLEYRVLHYNPHRNESSVGFLTLGYNLKERETISFEDDDGGFFLISNFGTNQYRCSGNCICKESDISQRSLIHLVSAEDKESAEDLARDHFQRECVNMMEEDSCKEKVISETFCMNQIEAETSEKKPEEEKKEEDQIEAETSEKEPEEEKKEEDQIEAETSEKEPEEEKKKEVKLVERKFFCRAECVPNRKLSRDDYMEHALKFRCELYACEGFIKANLPKDEHRILRNKDVLKAWRAYHGMSFDFLCSRHTEKDLGDYIESMCVSEAEYDMNFECHEVYRFPEPGDLW